MANLLQLRTSLVKRTGRWDLVSSRTAFTDNGMNEFIQAALDYLDISLVDRTMTRRFQVDLSLSPIVEVKYLIEPIHVWAVNGDSRILLSFLPEQEFRARYSDQLSQLDPGTPETYSQVSLNLAPSQAALTSSDYSDTFTYDADDLIFADEGVSYEYDNLLILPPPDETYTIAVEGVFRSVLSADTDVCFWSVNNPMLCQIVTRAFLELDQRNYSGSAGYFEAADNILDRYEATKHERESQFELQKLM